MKLTDNEKRELGLPLNWRDPTIDPNIEDKIELPRPKRKAGSVFKWVALAILVILFLVVSTDDLEVARSDAEFYQKMADSGLWPNR